MYTREEISRQKQAFWTAFGRYMQPVLSAEGIPVSWLNYKTGIGGIHFKMDVERDHAVIMILLSHSDVMVRQSHYHQLVQLKGLLQDALGETDWTWQLDDPLMDGKMTSRISKSLYGVNIHKESDWAAIISFLKPRMIALDEFWSMVKHTFEN
jgi:hypothetical protein